MTPIPSPSTHELLGRLVAVWRQVSTNPEVLSRPDRGRDLLSWAVFATEQPVAGLPQTLHQVVPLLDALLAEDPHIRACCRTASQLARALEGFVPAPFPAAWFEHASDEAAIEYLLANLFASEYRLQVFFRVYNLFPGFEPLAAPEIGATLRVLSELDVTYLTGEWTVRSQLVSRETGRAFLIFEGNADSETTAWWQARWEDAGLFARILKYLKDGAVDIDCMLIRYVPEWVTTVRRYGLAIVGRPRADVQPHCYTFSAQDQGLLARYLRAYLKMKPLLDEVSPTLRRVTATAGDYFEGLHRRERVEDRLVDLTVALEAMFSPDDRLELRFRVSLYAALLVGRTADERAELQRFLLRIYDARSALVHSGISPIVADKPKQRQVTLADLDRLGDLVRQAILRLTVLYARGTREKDSLRKRLDAVLVGAAKVEDLHAESDLEAFLEENSL